MPKIYVLNRGGYDFSAAEGYGTLVYCTEGPLKKHDISQMVRLLSGYIAGSDRSDYIIVTGLASLFGVACAMFGARHGRLNLLLYHNGIYHEHNIVLNEGVNNGKSTKSAKQSARA